MKVAFFGISLALLAASLSCNKRSASNVDTLTERLDNLATMEQREARVAEMRSFLWKHWIQRQPAKLFLTAVSKEGKVSHSEYTILLLPGNSLMLKVNGIRDRRGYQGQVIPKPIEGYEAYTVERVLSKNPRGIGAEAAITFVPTDAIVPPTNYWLRLKGWDGVLITYF